MSLSGTQKLSIEISANKITVPMLESLFALAQVMFGDKKLFVTITDIESEESAGKQDKIQPSI